MCTSPVLGQVILSNWYRTGMSGTVNIWVLKVTVKIEFLAAIKRITPPPGEEERCEALGYVLFALEVSVCWFLTISVSYSIEFKEEVDI